MFSHLDRCQKFFGIFLRFGRSYFDYFARCCNLGLLGFTGKVEGKRARGRQRQGYVASMKRRMEQSWTENKIIQSTKDRDSWTTMIVNVGGHGT